MSHSECAKALTVDDHDAAPFGSDEAAAAQGRQRAGNRFARSADPPRELALRELDEFGVARVGHLDEPTRDPADSLVSTELDALAIGVTQAVRDELEQKEREPRPLGKQLAKATPGDDN